MPSISFKKRGKPCDIPAVHPGECSLSLRRAEVGDEQPLDPKAVLRSPWTG